MSEVLHEDKIACPVWATLNLLNQRWTLHIVRSLLVGKKRFNELGRENGINPRTLRERLKQLEEQCVITRNVISTMPPNVEYELTDKGRALNDIFEALASWGQDWMCPEALSKISQGASKTEVKPALSQTKAHHSDFHDRSW
jgi:DNA-binding HxlR family transcriptional regulator